MVLEQGFILLLQKSWSAGSYAFWPVTIGNSYTHGGFCFTNFNGVVGTIWFIQFKCRIWMWSVHDMFWQWMLWAWSTLSRI